jgi:hypothetical protein
MRYGLMVMSRAQLAALTLTAILASAARAGECVYERAELVATLKAYAAGKAGHDKAADALYCLGAGRCANGDKWAGPIAERCFAELRASPDRAQLVAACTRILDRPRDPGRSECLTILATHGVQKAGPHDIFQLLTAGQPATVPTATLAMLGDARAVPLLVERYREAQRREAGELKNKRWDRRASESERRNVVNALWHLAAPESEPLLAEIAAGERDRDLRDRAARALERVRKAKPR